MRNLRLIAVPFALAAGLSAQTMLSSHVSLAAPRPAANSAAIREYASHALDSRAGSFREGAFRTGSFGERSTSGSGFRGRRSFPGGFIYPFGYFDDSFYSDALLSTGYPLAAEPPTIVVQPPAESSRYEPPAPPAQALMIELQGDRYVRVSGENTSAAQMLAPEDSQPRTLHGAGTSPEQSAEKTAKRQSATPAPEALPRDLSPVVLVFSDGHREEVSDYTIADGVLYTRGDYYGNGSWNKAIKLATLNVSETLATNRSRGNNFRLPTAPNEVIVRP